MMSAVSALTSANSALGSQAIWCPSFPADTMMTGRLAAVSWNTVGNSYFMPTGLHPPWT